MIKFFRKIRQRLLTENKFSKYLLYAIGEIVLVVIGILIAININNWNEFKKDRVLEKKVLENLVENLENNQRRLESGVRFIDSCRKSGSLVLSVLENGETYPDSINLHIHEAIVETGQIKLSKIGYEFFKDAGFRIIQNEVLVKEITIFFEEDVTRFHTDLSWEERGQADKERFLGERFLVKIFQTNNGTTPIHLPYNKKEIMKNNYFHSLISQIDMQRYYFKNVMSGHIESSEELLLSIKHELKSLE